MGGYVSNRCGICGGRIGILGGSMLRDAQLCPDCAARLSPFITSTLDLGLEDVRLQIALRDENKARLSSFSPTRTIYATDDESADEWRVMVDELAGEFVAFRGSQADLLEVNPDVFRLDEVSDVELAVGIITIRLDHPYIRELRLAPFYTRQGNEVRHVLMADRFRDRREKAAREIEDWDRERAERESRLEEQDLSQLREASQGSR
jgi:hypothetical protein